MSGPQASAQWMSNTLFNPTAIQAQDRGGQPGWARGLSKKPSSSPPLCNTHSFPFLQESSCSRVDALVWIFLPTNPVFTLSISVSPSTFYAFYQRLPLMAERCAHYTEVSTTASWVRVALTVTTVLRPKVHFPGHLLTCTVPLASPKPHHKGLYLLSTPTLDNNFQK